MEPDQIAEHIAAYRATRNEEQLARVVQYGSKLVYHFANLYARGSVRDDLVQAGFEGLLKAIKRFDHKRGIAFSTYASHCILGEIKHYIRQEISMNIHADETKATWLILADRLPRVDIGQGGLANDHDLDDRIAVKEAIGGLNQLQRKVIYLLFYLGLPQVQAAQRLGISQRQVSRVLHESLNQMARLLHDGEGKQGDGSF